MAELCRPGGFLDNSTLLGLTLTFARSATTISDGIRQRNRFTHSAADSLPLPWPRQGPGPRREIRIVRATFNW